MTPETASTLSIDSEYRDARRLTSLLCIVLGWSSARFELEPLTLSNAVIGHPAAE